MLRLEHPIHRRAERVAAHRFLWFAWGNAEARVAHDVTMLTFAGTRDEAFHATVDRLRRMGVSRGRDFLVAPPGTREDRTRGSKAALYRRA